MKIEQYTYWSMTINNPDENDWIMIKNPNEKYIRSLVWTREVGEENQTEHIQAWIRLQRNNSMTFMKKLYPRGHFRFIDRDEYNENTHNYAQKDDETTAGKHHINLHDPLPANDTLLYKVLDRAFTEQFGNVSNPISFIYDELTLSKLETLTYERQMVIEKSGLEKIFCSPVYEKMKKSFWRQILHRIILKNAEQRSSDDQQEGEADDEDQSRSSSSGSQDNEECESEADEGSTESTDDQASEDFD